MTQVLIGFAGGIILGLVWRAVVLYPAILLTIVYMISTSGVSWSNAGLILLVVTALQGGYLCGVAARGVAGPARSANRWRVTFNRH